MKLKRIGINNKELKWFESYLSGRFQQTKIGNEISSKKEIRIGLPQGTVLSSLLFSIYINDICNILDRINLFADDTAIYFPTKDIPSSKIKMNQILNKIHKYLNENKLKLNIEKYN